MKNQLYSTTNEDGFILPYVLFIISLLFLLITANINHYQREIEITDRHIQQVRIETLFQMGREKVKSEIEHIQLNDTLTYDFPNGEVRIEVKALKASNYELLFNITSDSNEHRYEITNILQVEENVTE
ncbi:hypothetical protein [Oceanobacillus rekensis]|uniref:hypothetical protein n=1 Tax=Oceanobacillus rekensis TaxID=937927 RepID=UPI000B44E183|nr:hypothetical protein [Oceanobacillus rekensis]